MTQTIQSSIKLSYSNPSHSDPVDLLSRHLVNLDPQEDILLITLYENASVATINHGRYSKSITKKKYLELFTHLIPLYEIKHQIPSHSQLSLSFRDQKGHDLKWSSLVPDPSLDPDEVMSITHEENSMFDYALVIIQNLFLSTFAFSLKSRRKCGLN